MLRVWVNFVDQEWMVNMLKVEHWSNVRGGIYRQTRAQNEVFTGF